MSQSGLEGGKYFHRDGTPAETYMEVESEVNNGEIGNDVINGVNVRTYFTGYNVGTFVEPKIFTTSVSSGLHMGDYDYATEVEAQIGHADWVRKVSVPVPDNVVQLAKEIRELATTNEYKIADYILNTRKCCSEDYCKSNCCDTNVGCCS